MPFLCLQNKSTSCRIGESFYTLSFWLMWMKDTKSQNAQHRRLLPLRSGLQTCLLQHIRPFPQLIQRFLPELIL
uniref:Uncharacterized protein n=1 Tax=Labrus bergylta TaxID=56723 RepID=A0A3Q3F5T4_9LABR